MKYLLSFSLLFSALILLLSCNSGDQPDCSIINENCRVPNLIKNGGFEEGDIPIGEPDNWEKDAWRLDDAVFTWDDEQVRTGSKSIKIDAPFTNDARWIQTQELDLNTWYFLSGWIKTYSVADAPGANLSLLQNRYREHSTGVFGSQDWTYNSLLFNSEDDAQVTVAARLGATNADTTGTAWFDDLQLKPILPMDPHPSWKILVLIYQNTNFEVTDDSSVYHHYIASMSQDEIDRAAQAARDFAEIDIPTLTSGNMVPEITIRFPERTLNELTPIASGFWPSQENTAAELDPLFDSVIIIWDPRATDTETGEYKWIGYADGLTPPVGVTQTYLSMQLDAAINRGHRNVFKHEFGHSILFHFDAMGLTEKPTVTNHAEPEQYVNCITGEYYEWVDETLDNPIPNSIYNNDSGFTHDYYSGTTATTEQPDRCLGISADAWAYGGPVSNSGSIDLSADEQH